jgi:hypothetical protein
MVYLSKTQDCQFIEIKSDTISDFILNPSNYTSFTISAKINCCSEGEVSQTITRSEIGSNVFTLQFPVNPTTIIDSIVFENIFTHQQFTLPIGSAEVADYMCSTGDITLLFPIIDAWFVTNFGSSVTQGYIYDAITNTCVYTITDLPENITPVNMVTYVVGNQQDIYFGYFPIEGMFFNSNVMYISPSFFNMVNFTDGIYSFTLTFNNKENNIITESNCFFLDCKTGCEVSTKLQELQKIKEIENATNIFLLHYTLTEGSNCGCNCDELCEIFRKLCLELNSSSCLCGCV